MRVRIPKGTQIQSLLVLTVRLGLGALFIIGSLPKINFPYQFLSSVYGYEFTGPTLGLLVAVILPWIEFLVGVCLIGGIWVGGALLMSIVMGVLFTVVISYALWQGLNISCGCFGTMSREIISYSTLIRAVSILIVSVAAYASVFRQEGWPGKRNAI